MARSATAKLPIVFVETFSCIFGEHYTTILRIRGHLFLPLRSFTSGDNSNRDRNTSNAGNRGSNSWNNRGDDNNRRQRRRSSPRVPKLSRPRAQHRQSYEL